MNFWLSIGGAFLGLWLIAWPLHTTNDLYCGAALVLLGLLRHKGTAWPFALIGFWLGLAPLVFLEKNPACFLNDTIVGMLVLALFVKMPAMPNAVPDTGPSVPPGFNYNPSSWPQRLPIAFLAFVGWMISRYMAAYQLGYIDTVWDPFFEHGTIDVITSDVSKKFPVPDAGLGAFAYSLEMVSTFKGGTRRWRTEPWMVILFGLLAVPLSLTSVILIILQPLVVGAWCTLCLTTAFCMLILIALSLDEVTAVLRYLRTKEKPFFQLLIEGGSCKGAKEDKRTPHLDASTFQLLRAGFWGVKLRWDVVIAVLAGATLMAQPSNFDHVFGAFTIVIAMVSMAEVIQKLRIVNFFLAPASIIFTILTLFS